MKVSVIITAWKEPETIKKSLNSFVNPDWNSLIKEIKPQPYEILVVCPDEETWRAAKQVADKYKYKNIIRVKDKQEGKPKALNMGIKLAKGDMLFLTDADVFCSKENLKNIIKHFKGKKVGGVTGRPVSIDKKDNFMGYMGHLLADAAHHKRMVTMKPNVKGKSLKIVSKEPHFFVLSGYNFAMRNLGIKTPEDCLIEDAYFSYEINNKGYKLIYEPEAKVFVKYADNLKDWYKQKLRSVGGYVQLWKYDVIREETKVRDFWKELEYFWFPIKYAKNLKEILWSLLIYPIRLYLWIMIFYERRIKKKSFEETWVRIESTK